MLSTGIANRDDMCWRASSPREYSSAPLLQQTGKDFICTNRVLRAREARFRKVPRLFCKFGKSFPHLDEVSVSANCLQIYDYGRDLYDALLAAIDMAQESIYLETYIWKYDAPDQEFMVHLARKAVEGHGKRMKKLVFQA